MGIQGAMRAGKAVEAPAPSNALFKSERFSLLMRMAKLVGTSAEFICIVSELSTIEVKLRTFHPLPESRFALELPGGDLYFVEKIWERDGEAGFRFSTPVDIDVFVSEASPFTKRQLRLRTAITADLALGSVRSPIVIRDLSQEGARIEADVPLALYQRVGIEAKAFAAPVFGKVHLTSKQEYGISFERGFGLGELARIAWSLHDPAAGASGPRLEVVNNKNLRTMHR